MKPLQLQLRRGRPDDAALLATLGRASFVETYGALNRPEDTQAHLDEHFGPAQQAAELANPRARAVLAFDGAQAAGFALVEPLPAPPGVHALAPAAPVALHRFYVLRPWHGRGVAAPLFDAAADAARELDADLLWLSVWDRNPRARAFYEKHGLALAGTMDFRVGDDVQRDLVFVLRL